MNAKIAIGMSLLLAATWATGQTTVSSKLEAHLTMTSPDLNLFFLDPGFLDLNQSHGSVGMMSNPAGLGKTKILDIFVAGSMSRSFKSDMDLKLADSSQLTGQIMVPATLALKDQGGLDYIGVAGKAGPFGIGVCIEGNYGFEAGIDQGDVDVTQHFQYFYQDLIPSGTVLGGETLDVNVPITWTVEATGTVKLESHGSAQFTNRPLFVGMGTKWGSLNVGLGAKRTRIEAVASMNLKFTDRIDSLRGTVNGPSGTVTLDSIHVNTPFDDSIFFDRFGSQLVGDRYSLVFGSNMEIPILKLGFSIEQGLPYKLDGWYFNKAGLPYGQPTLNGVDLSGLSYDLGTRTISGSTILDLGGVEYKHKSDSDTGSIDMPATTNLRASLGLKFWGFRLGVNGGMDMLSKKFPSLGTAYASVGTSLNVKIVNLRLGVAGRWPYVSLEENKMISTPPSFLLGVGAGIPLPFGELMSSARINLTNGLLKVSNMEKEEKLNPLETVALGAGLRLSF